MPAAGRKRSLEFALEPSEGRYRRLFETAQDGILILDAESGRIIDANPFLLDLLDYPFESIIGLELWQIGLFEDIAANKTAFAKLQTEEYIRYENHPLRTKSGKVVPVEFVSNVYSVGAARVIQCNIRDISQRTEIQTAADTRVAALELTGKAKDDVIAVLSHELRTPLNAISAMIDVVELGPDVVGQLPQTDVPPHFSKNAVDLIRRNVQTLVRLINELLDLTHLAKGTVQLNLETVDAHDVIGFVLKNLESQQRAKEVGIELRLLAQHCHIQADSAKVEQVLTNLIGNAVKFTAKGGKVSIVTRNEGGERLVVEVSDSGIGIPADALARIFSPFEQGDSSIHSRYGGLGLGLSIAHTLMNAHGGTLEAASEGLNRGAKFTARFKLDQPPSVGVPETCGPGELTGAGLHILLVEDHDDARHAMCTLLGSQGYAVKAAATAQAALDLGARHSFDMLIVDVGLPDGSGLELLARIKQHSPGLKGIAMSGYGMPQDALDAEKAGFSSHLVKPVQFHQLRRILETLIPEAKAASLQQMRE
ncbi:MAG: ATP-binding protein [Nitrospirota bacterium]